MVTWQREWTRCSCCRSLCLDKRIRELWAHMDKMSDMLTTSLCAQIRSGFLWILICNYQIFRQSFEAIWKENHISSWCRIARFMQLGARCEHETTAIRIITLRGTAAVTAAEVQMFLHLSKTLYFSTKNNLQLWLHIQRVSHKERLATPSLGCNVVVVVLWILENTKLLLENF